MDHQGTHAEMDPPETSNDCALTQRLSSQSRLAIAPPTSSGSPTRPSAVCAESIASSSAFRPPPRSVRIAPGMTELARIRRSPSYFAMYVVRTSRPPLKLAHGATPGRCDPRRGARHVDDVATIGDQGSSACVRKNGPSRALEVNGRAAIERASVTAVIGASARYPALLTRASKLSRFQVSFRAERPGDVLRRRESEESRVRATELGRAVVADIERDRRAVALSGHEQRARMEEPDVLLVLERVGELTALLWRWKADGLSAARPASASTRSGFVKFWRIQ